MSFEPDPDWPAPNPSFNAYRGLPVDLPFPIISPFAIRGDLQKLAPPDTGLIRLDHQYPHYARAKLAGLVSSKCDFLSRASGDPQHRLGALLDAIAAITATMAGFAVLDGQGGRRRIMFATSGLTWSCDGARATFTAHRGDAQTLAEWLNQHLLGRDPASWLAYGLALSIQEDFVVMRAADPGGESLSAPAVAPVSSVPPVPAAPVAPAAPADAFADALMVCLPSGWRPEEKLGASLAAIHAPVADGQALRRASAGLSQAMLTKGPFERHVWTLSDSAVLNRHPDQVAPPPATSSEVWYRCERQTLLALPAHRRALFFIRVYVAAAADAANSAARRELLVSALRSMSPAVIEYKNIGKLRDQLLALWG